jgi:hypothetical protein
MRQLEGGGSRDDQAVADHLAVCQPCARRAHMAAQLKWLWDATRPPEPTSESWDGLWSSVTAGLGQTDVARGDRRWPIEASVAGSRPRSERTWPAGPKANRRALLAAMILTQAAAVLLALGWYFHIRWRASKPPLAPQLDLVFDIEEGQVPLVRWSGSKSEVSDLSSFQSYNGEDPWLVFLNDVESASTAVAMAE